MRTALVILAALVLAACASASGSPDPKSLALRLSDLPAGYQVDKAYYRTNAKVAGEGDVTVAQLRAWGRVNGYELDTSEGLRQINSLASVYRTSAGAAASGATTRQHCGKNPTRRVSLGGADFGPGACFAVSRMTRDGVSVEVWVLAWRRGDVTAAVFAASLPGAIKPASVLRLAKVQDARMRNA